MCIEQSFKTVQEMMALRYCRGKKPEIEGDLNARKWLKFDDN